MLCVSWGTVIDQCQSNLACTQNALQPLLICSIALCPSYRYEVGCHSITYVSFIADSVTHVFKTFLPPFHTYSRSSPSGKAAGEEVPMEDNPAYGDVNIYDTVKEPKEN